MWKNLNEERPTKGQKALICYQAFGENSLCIAVKDYKEAECVFAELRCNIGIIKDLDNQELFIIEKI